MLFFLDGLIIKKNGIREMSFESNKLDKSYDMVSLCETAKHTDIAGMNMEI